MSLDALRSRRLPARSLVAPIVFAMSLITGALICGCATSYRPAHGGKGYTDSQILSNEFSVGFQGNGQTTLEDVYDFALLRSAEVVLEHGGRFFAVMDASNTSSLHTFMLRQRYYSGAMAPGGFGIPAASGYIVDVQEPKTDFKPGTLLRIKCFAEKPVKPFTYDAAELRRTLRAKHGLRS
jgi:hypothetical protein